MILIYTCSIPSPIDKGNFDTFDTNDIELNKDFLTKDEIKTADNSEDIIVSYGFKTELVSPKDEKFYMTATIKEILKTYKVLISDVQFLVDDICRNVYDNQALPSTCAEIIKYKDKLKSLIVQDLLKKENKLFYDIDIYGFGIITSNEKIVGTFEGIRIDNSNNVTLLYKLLNLDLNNIYNPKFIFYSNKNYKYNIESYSFDSDILLNCNIDYIDNYVPENIKELKLYNEFENINEMFLDRNKLIYKEKEEIYDDDIDFDFD